MEAIIYSKELHRGQRTIKHFARRFNTVVCGRRFGKTDLSVALCQESVLLGHRVGLYAPIFKDVSDTWENLKKQLAPLITKINESEYRIEFITGAVIEFWSLKDKSSQSASRGRKYHRVIYDEFQKINTHVLQYSWEKVVRATLIDFRGDAFFFGTPPDTKSHYAYRLFAMGAVNSKSARGFDVLIPEDIKDNPDPDFMAFRAPTSANPYISIDEIAAIKRTISNVSFLQEIQCEFIESSGAMFLCALQDLSLQNSVFAEANLFDKRLRNTISFDFNKRPMAAVLIQHSPNYDRIRAVQEFGAPDGQKVSIHYTCNQIKQYFLDKYGVRFGKQQNGQTIPCQLDIRITGDASGVTSHGLDKDLTRNFFTEIRDELGISEQNFTLKASNPQHREAWHQMNDYLELHPDIQICPNHCPRLKTDMLSCRSTGEKKIDKAHYDPHYFDAFRYFFSTFLPQKFKATPQQILQQNKKENDRKNSKPLA